MRLTCWKSSGCVSLKRWKFLECTLPSGSSFTWDKADMISWHRRDVHASPSYTDTLSIHVSSLASQFPAPSLTFYITSTRNFSETQTDPWLRRSFTAHVLRSTDELCSPFINPVVVLNLLVRGRRYTSLPIACRHQSVASALTSRDRR